MASLSFGILGATKLWHWPPPATEPWPLICVASATPTRHLPSPHIVGDLVALIDTLGVDQVFVVGHDWGAFMAWFLCLFRPDKIKALVNLSVPYFTRHPSMKPIETLRAVYGDDYYVCRFQEPGVIEAEFASVGAVRVMEKFLTSIDPGPLIIPKDIWLCDPTPITLPSWLSTEDVNYYATKFEQKGFSGGLSYYRAMDLNWEVSAPWVGAQVKVPAKFIVGKQDLVYNTPFIKEYIHSEAFKKDVPLLKEVVVMEGAGHFINQEKPHEINAHICNFFQQF